LNNKIVPLLISLIVLVAINIAVTSYVALRAPVVAPTASTLVDESIVSEEKAAALAKLLIGRYNANDVSGLYAIFDDFAKAQISQEQLTEQITKLHSVLGSVGTYAYDRAELAGTDAGRTFYNVHYKVALSGSPFSHGTLKLTVVKRGGELRLVGFFLNGTDTIVPRQP